MTNKKYKKLYKSQLQIILNQLNQCNMTFENQPGVFFAKSNRKMQEKIMFLHSSYKFSPPELDKSLAMAFLNKNIMLVNLESTRKYNKKEKHKKIYSAKETIYHELWHLYEEYHVVHHPKLSYINDSVFQLTKNYFFKKWRTQNKISEKDIARKIKNIFEDKFEFLAYLFADTCLYKMPFAIEFFQKQFNIDISQLPN